MTITCKLIGQDCGKTIMSLNKELQGSRGFFAHSDNPFPRSSLFHVSVFDDITFITYQVDPAPEGDNGGMIP